MSDMLARLMALAAMQSGGADLSDYYTKAETDRRISDEVARIVSDAPEDFDTLRELSDWIATHEESAAAMNSAIQANTAGVAALYAEVATKAPQSTTYTKNEVDAALSDKVDKVTGKGLSTNDFTDADKANLTTALATANAAAPQATTYTKTEVDTALAAKLNTADVDVALSSTSTNPVQNKAVQAPVARLIDAAAKNLLYIHDQNVEAQGISYVVKDGIVSASGTATGTPSSRANLNSVLLLPGEYTFSGCPANGSDTTYRVDLYTSTDDANYTLDNNMIDRGTGVAFTISTQMYVRPTIRFQNGYVATNLAFKPMVCTAEDYDISPEFVPYTPTMREMYEMLLALQNAQNG